ncbi:MAG: PIN domain-containing protein [Candidatus Njordarchaeota archaeon]
MRVVLDTTYILPAFNIVTKKFGKGDFKFLLESDVVRIVHQALIIESKWVLLGLIRRGKIREPDGAFIDFNEGLRFLKYSGKFRFVDTLDERVDLNETEIYTSLGITDYFDRILIATARAHDALLLTEDDDILSLRDAKTKIWNGIKILSWHEFKKELSFTL